MLILKFITTLQFFLHLCYGRRPFVKTIQFNTWILYTAAA
jgi:hypothetical protein